MHRLSGRFDRRVPHCVPERILRRRERTFHRPFQRQCIYLAITKGTLPTQRLCRSAAASTTRSSRARACPTAASSRPTSSFASRRVRSSPSPSAARLAPRASPPTRRLRHSATRSGTPSSAALALSVRLAAQSSTGVYQLAIQLRKDHAEH